MDSPQSFPTPSESASATLRQREERYLAPGLQEVAQLAGIVIREGRGCWLTDLEGRRYLDFMAGVAVCSLGHAHPKFVTALAEQLGRVTVGSFTTENRVELLEWLAALLPAGLDRVQFFSGGSEAVEAALRLAKAATGRFEVLGFWGGFHGKTGGVLGLIGDPFKQGWGPPHPGLHLAPYADCYRCPFRLEYPGCGLLCLDFVRQVIRRNTTGSLAAIIVEPMQGTAGNIIPPPEFLPALQEIARENGALLIADEMITGFGRTGRMFGCEHTGQAPDVMTIGKGLGNGFPVTGLVSTTAVTATRPFSLPSSSSSSFGGNPLAVTAALAAVRTIVEEELAANAREVGGHLLAGLRRLQEKYDFIGAVRGRGLLIGIELVRDRASREPLPRELTRRMFLETLRRGLLCMNYKAAFRITRRWCSAARRRTSVWEFSMKSLRGRRSRKSSD